MSYIGRKGAISPLNSADIPDNSITGAKIVAGTIEASDVAADMATQAELDLKANIASPTFTGIATAPSLVLTPGSAPATTEGAIYYNSTTNMVTLYNGAQWVQITNSSSGGVITTYDSGGNTYLVHTFLTSGVFTPSSSFNVDYLVVGGGGGGGPKEGACGGGGGAGAFRTATSFAVTAQTYAITVGAGGDGGQGSGAAGHGKVGGDSIFSTITSNGGAGGGYGGANPLAYSGNGSGSAGGYSTTGGSGGAYGNDGGDGGGTSGSYGAGGGGGAGGDGVDGSTSAGGAGGAGEDQVMGLSAADSYTLLTNASAGHVVSGARYFSGGGGGGVIYSGSAGAGGSGGGGAGGAPTSDGVSATSNSGGGGGGSGNSTNGIGGNGGSGIVIIRYAI